MNIPNKLMEEKLRLHKDLEFSNDMIKNYTDDWVEYQKKLIDVNNAIEILLAVEKIQNAPIENPLI